MKTVNTWLIAILVCIVVSSTWQLDADEDHSGEWMQSTALEELHAADARALRTQAAAQKICAEERGPNSEALWTEARVLTCTTRRGARPARNTSALQVAAQ